MGCISLAVLVFVPAIFPALNNFDPLKRLMWAVLALLLVGWNRNGTPDTAITSALRVSWLVLIGWMIVRTLLRSPPLVEFEVLMIWLLPMVLFRLGCELDPGRVVRPMTLLLLGIAILQSTLMLLQYLGLDILFSATTASMSYKPGRMIGTIGYQNQAADALALCGVALLLHSGRRWWRVLGLILLINVVGLTANRGAIVSLVLTMALTILYFVKLTWHEAPKTPMRMGLAGLLAVVVIAGSLWLVPTTRVRIQEVCAHGVQTPALATRATMARVAWNMWMEKPLAGWGGGQYAFQYLSRLAELCPGEITHAELHRIVFAREAHNDVLQFAAEFGAVGLLLLGILLIEVWRAVWRTRRMTVEALACVWLLVYMLFSSAINFTWQTAVAGPLAALLLGILVPRECGPSVGVMTGSRRTWWRVAEDHIKRWVAVCLVVFFGMEALMNLWLPRQLESGPQWVANMMPDQLYRYQALVGASLARSGDYAGAQKTLQKSLEGYRDPLVFNNLGYVLAKQGLWSDAALIYQTWARCGVLHEQALGNLATAYEQMEAWGEAAKTLKHVSALWPERSSQLVFRQAIMSLRAGEATEAVKLLEPLIIQTNSTSSAEVDNALGAAYLMLGKTSKAEPLFHSALKKNPELSSAKENLDRLKKVVQP